MYTAGRVSCIGNDWNRLLHSLIKVGASHRYGDGEEDALHPMLENHVLTVFTDIAHKKLSNYGNSFANVQGTAIRAAYTQNYDRTSIGG